MVEVIVVGVIGVLTGATPAWLQRRETRRQSNRLDRAAEVEVQSKQFESMQLVQNGLTAEVLRLTAEVASNRERADECDARFRQLASEFDHLKVELRSCHSERDALQVVVDGYRKGKP